MPDWVADIANILGILGFVVSILTYINTFRLRGKVVTSNEKQMFFAKRGKLIGEVDGFINSISDNGIFTVELLSSIHLYVTRLETSYTFVSSRLLKELNFVKNHIDDYKNDVLTESKNISVDKIELLEKLTSISALIEKEVC